MDNSPIMFLDIDGVIAPYGRRYHRERQANRIDCRCVERVRKLQRRFSARVVVVSSWRSRMSERTLRDRMRAVGLGELLHIAPIVGSRSEDICAWLQRSPAAPFVVLDDDWHHELIGFGERLVRPSPKLGLTFEDMEAAAAALCFPVLEGGQGAE